MSSSEAARLSGQNQPSDKATTSQQPPTDNDADDLDDLDDVLDEFSNPQPAASSASQPPKAQPPPPPASGASAASASAKQATAEDDDGGLDPDGLDDILSQDFAKELAQGMEALMKELGQPGNAGAADGAATGAAADPQFSEEELMKQFEAMMAGFSNPSAAAAAATAAPSPAAPAGPSASSSGAAAPQQPANFNDALKATMARLKESDASATAFNNSAADPFAALAGGNGDDMAKLLAALGGEGGGDGMDNPELAKMLEGMMDELMSKEILYEPLKELRDKYPAYLQGPDSASDTPDDRKRYEAQSKCVSEIVALFESPSYDSKNKETSQKIQELMNEMQDCGSPPKQIVGDMPAELENIPGFGGDKDECTIM